MKKINKARRALVLLGFSVMSAGIASAQEPTTLIGTLTADLKSAIDSLTGFQMDVFKAALVIVVGFVVYRMVKTVANKLG